MFTQREFKGSKFDKNHNIKIYIKKRGLPS